MNRDIKHIIAQGLSGLLHPLLMPVYFAVIMLFAPAFAPALPMKVKLAYTSIVSLSFSLLPLTLLLLLEHLGKISSVHLYQRHERFLPMLLIMLCYFGGIVWLQQFNAPSVLIVIMQGVSIAVMATATISLLWKVSAHTTSVGGGFGICVVLALIYRIDLSLLTIIIVLLAGTVGWSRLYLERHTLSQVLYGYLLGFSSILMTYAWHIYF